MGVHSGLDRGVEGLYRDNGKESGSYYLGYRVLGFPYWGKVGTKSIPYTGTTWGSYSLVPYKPPVGLGYRGYQKSCR